MTRLFKLSCTAFALCFAAANVSSAVVVYSISDSTSFGDNANAAGAGSTLVDNMDGTFTLATAEDSGGNVASYIDSGPSNISALTAASTLGRALVASDTVIVRGTIDSGDANYNANGVEFGVVSAVGFRSDPNLLLQIDNDGIRGGEAPFFSTVGPNGPTFTNATTTPGATEESLNDGYSFEAVYTSSGITYTVSDIVPENTLETDMFTDTSYTYILDLSADVDYDLLTDVGNGFGYYSFQKTGTGVQSTVISNFEIEVVADGGGGSTPGDFNGDNVVDAADYAVWRNNLNELDEETLLSGNGDNMNGVDIGDYLLWRENFGQGIPGLPAFATVPEPGSFALLLSLIATGACRAQRRHAS